MAERFSSTATAIQTGASAYRKAADFFQLRHETMPHSLLDARAIHCDGIGLRCMIVRRDVRPFFAAVPAVLAVVKRVPAASL